MSGSSASPIRSVVWAWRWLPQATVSRAAARIAKRIKSHRSQPSVFDYCRGRVLNEPTPAAPVTFRATAEGGDQFSKHRRKAAVGRDDRRRRTAVPTRAVTGRCVSDAIGHKLRHFAAAAVDHVEGSGCGSGTPAAD